MPHPLIVSAGKLGELEVAEQRLEAGGSFRSFQLKELELIFLESGELSIATSGSAKIIGRGDVVMRRVDTEITITARSLALVFTIRVPRFFRGLDTFSSLGAEGWSVIGGGACANAIRKAHQQFTANHANRVVLEALCLTAVGVALPAEDEEINEQYAWLQPVIQRLSELTRPPSTRELATLAGVTSAQLARAFRQLKGCTMGAYQRQLRIAEACRLMHNPHISLTRIARMCGFSDQSHFSNTFRRDVGCSPRDYRRRLEATVPSGPAVATFDPVGEYRFRSHTADGRPYDGTISIMGSPWAYHGIVRTSVMPDVSIDSIAISGDRMVLTGRVPAGLAVLQLRMRGDSFTGGWRLAAEGRPLSGHRQRTP